MTMRRADGTVAAGKYLAYWEKQPDGWRALAYKRGVAKEVPPAAPVSYLLPKQITAVKRDAAAIERDRESLANAERLFSKDAQTIGLGPAFKKYGSPDAINLGGPDVQTFLFGNEAIGTAIGGTATTRPVNWGPEKTLIAPAATSASRSATSIATSRQLMGNRRQASRSLRSGIAKPTVNSVTSPNDSSAHRLALDSARTRGTRLVSRTARPDSSAPDIW